MVISAIIITLFSCRELYYPEVEGMENVIIVDGFVTDQSGTSSIKLSVNSDTEDRVVALRNAMVYISDDQGNITPFHDISHIRPGHYHPGSYFTGITGRNYTLHIETQEGDIYESSPQKMVPAATVDSVYPRHAIKEYLYTDHRGNNVRQRVPGIEVFTALSSEDGNILRFRIEPALLLLYNFYHFRLPDVDVYYRWKKISLTDAPQINMHPFEGGYESVKDHLISFLPGNNLHYDLSREEPIHRKIIIIRYFTLNHDAYRFHFEAYKQIHSENKLFDPVVSQLPTNIRCTSDPGKPVIGFFEASSTATESYMLVVKSYDNIFEFIRIADMENVPDSGSSLNRKPDFWQD